MRELKLRAQTRGHILESRVTSPKGEIGCCFDEKEKIICNCCCCCCCFFFFNKEERKPIVIDPYLIRNGSNCSCKE